MTATMMKRFGLSFSQATSDLVRSQRPSHPKAKAKLRELSQAKQQGMLPPCGLVQSQYSHQSRPSKRRRGEIEYEQELETAYAKA